MTEEELAECLSTLLGMNPEGGRSELGTCDPTGKHLIFCKAQKFKFLQLL